MTGLGQTFITSGDATGIGSINLNSVTFFGSGNLGVRLFLTTVAAHIGESGPATLKVSTYAMASGGSLDIDLTNDPTPGTGHDRLNVTGTVTLGGTLNVARPDGVCIAPDQTFEIMTMASRGGDFAVKNGLDLGNGRILSAVPAPTNYRLVSSGPACDDTPPTIAPNVTGTLGDNGWYVSDVSVTWSVSDAESEVTTQGCEDQGVTSDTHGVTFTCTASSGGGTASQSVTIKRDATAPVVSASRAPDANAFGWNNGDVIATYSATDATSGLVGSGSATQTFASEGANQGGSHVFTDNAGNSATAAIAGISIDRTAPIVTVTRSPLPDASGWNDTDVTATWTASDALSGIDGEASATHVFTEDGEGQSATRTFSDRAGNSASATISGINIDKTPEPPPPPPVLMPSCSANPGSIWPPNNKMVAVRVNIGGEGITGFVLRSVTNNETGEADAQGWAVGTPDLDGSVRATRRGSGSGRTYTLTYDVSGANGASGSCDVTVRVPHDRGR